MLGRFGTDELAASSYAGIWIMLTYCLFNGFTSATATLSSQSLGAKNLALTGIWLQTGIFCGLLMAPPVALSWWYIGDLLRATGSVEGHLCDLASTFGRTMVLKIVPDIILSVIIEWLIAQEIVRPIAWINLIFLAVNLGLNILFVYGVSGVWDGLGFTGSPLGTYRHHHHHCHHHHHHHRRRHHPRSSNSYALSSGCAAARGRRCRQALSRRKLSSTSAWSSF